MLAEQSLKQANLEESLAQLQAQIRKEPANAQHRIFLFQLLAVLGQWDRALTQLKVMADLDAGTLPMVQTYREAIRCERLRAEIFAGRRSPIVFGKPEEWIALVIEALHAEAAGAFARAEALRGQAFEQAPTTKGAVDERAFDWIADADSRLGPVLEAIVNGRYYWIPFDRLREVEIEEPADLRDLVWAPTQLTFANGGQAVGLIPTRYVGSDAAEDPLIRLSRKTEWVAVAENVYAGRGQRMLATDADEVPLLDIRRIVLETEDASADADPAAGPFDAGISVSNG